MKFTVLTGDIVDSTARDARALDAAFATLGAGCAEIARWLPPDMPHGFARRGGDGWQFAFAGPPLGLRASLLLRAHLRQSGDSAPMSRIAVARGRGALPENGDPNAAHGPAFTASGRLLGRIGRPVLMAHASGGAPSATLALADHIAQGWTRAQARAMAAALPLDAPTRAEIGASLGITRQAVDQALRSAGYPALSAAMAAMEAP